MKDIKKSNQLFREFNTLMRIKPVLLNKCKPKHISYGGCCSDPYDTLGVEAEQVRIYKTYGVEKTLAFSVYLIKGVHKVRVSTEDANSHEGKVRERNHQDVDLLDTDEFHEKLRQVVRLLRDNETNRNLKYAIEQFTAPEYIL